MVHIYPSARGCDDRVLEGFRAQASATVHEAMGRRGAMDPEIKPLDRSMKVVGRALTVKCHPGDNVMLVKAISMARKDDVIVLDMGGLRDIGPFGEVLATECKRRGMGGLVFNCCVRDSEEIIRMGLPVFSAGLCIRGTVKASLGTINHVITCGGQIVRPGDLILGDADGVVVVPAEEAEAVLAASETRVRKEEDIIRRLLAGESAFDIYNYQPLMERLGCVEQKAEEE